MMPMFIIGPMVQILGFVALWAQWSETKKSRGAGAQADDALSVKGLMVQAVVFLLVGLSFLWRMRILEEEKWSGYWIADLDK